MSDTLEAQYRQRHGAVLLPLAAKLEKLIFECVEGQPRIDRISARAKNVDRFLKKAAISIGGKAKYVDPIAQIQDQVGARIVTFYPDDVPPLVTLVKKHFRAIESKNHVPDSEWEFGYFGHHSILKIPNAAIEDGWDRDLVPEFFELQIKTLFQHAWSEANHDLGYKPGDAPLTPDQVRRFAFTSAQAWGADLIFNGLFHERSPEASPKP